MTATGPAGTTGTQTTYDAADLPTLITHTAFGQTVLTVSNTYAKTNELRKTVAAGRTWSFGFGEKGELSSLSSDRALATRSLDVYGRPAAVRAGLMYPGYAYFSDLFESRVAYDGRDRVSSMALSGTGLTGVPSHADTFTYDLADRLTGWTRTGDGAATASYAWDAAGNLDALRRSGEATTTFSHDLDDRLTKAERGASSSLYINDAFGRRTARTGGLYPQTTYSWDPLGHLVGIAGAGMTVTYAYGVTGMREKATVITSGGTTTTESVWSGDRLVCERDSDGTLLTYVWGPERTPLALTVTRPGIPAATYSYHTDSQGSVVAITDDGGGLVASYAYDAFGAPAWSGGSDAWLTSRNPLRYRSCYYDTATALYYLPARYYEPATARFLSPDPAPASAGDPLSLNRFAYCLGDPVNHSDPTGAITDTDGNGRIDGWDSAMWASGHTKDPVRKAYFEARAKVAYYGKHGDVQKAATAERVTSAGVPAWVGTPVTYLEAKYGYTGFAPPSARRWGGAATALGFGALIVEVVGLGLDVTPGAPVGVGFNALGAGLAVGSAYCAWSAYDDTIRAGGSTFDALAAAVTPVGVTFESLNRIETLFEGSP
jgi:RHS repeat-associated protein